MAPPKKHGHATRGANSKTYIVWGSILQRCCNPNAVGYSSYGGRGIGVCDRWLASFENFLEDMGEVPRGLTIERVDVNGDYEPGNCVWATTQEQSHNRRTNRWVILRGEHMLLTEALRELGASSSSLYYLRAKGLSDQEVIEDLVARPRQARGRTVVVAGTEMALSAALKLNGMNPRTFFYRVSGGMTYQEAYDTPLQLQKSNKRK